MKSGGQAISYIKFLSDFRFHIIYTFAICMFFFIAYLNAKSDPTLTVFLLLCLPIYVIVANKYCVWIRWLVVLFVTVGILFRISQIFRGIELHPDGLIFFVAIFLTLPSLILIGVGLYFWVREKRLKKLPRARKAVDVFLVIAAVTVVTYIASNPLRQSAGDIEKALLEEIPIGASLKDARKYFLISEEAVFSERNRTIGSVDGKFMQLREFDWERHDKDIIANQEDGGAYFQAGLGKYQGFPWRVFVHVDLVFDANEKLKYLHVWKMQDSL